MDKMYSEGVINNIRTGMKAGLCSFRFSWYESDESAFLLIKKHFPTQRFYLYVSGASIENKTVFLDFL